MSKPLKRSRRSDPPALRIQIDGAARGNPGPAGVGVVLTDPQGRRLKEIALYLGETTNNVAESIALIIALQEALKAGYRQVSVSTDSELLARQVTGDYRVRDRQLQWLHALIQNLVQGVDDFQIRHVPREENRPADRLANRAISEALRRNPALKRNPNPPAPTVPQQSTFW